MRVGLSLGAYDPGLVDTQMDDRHSLTVAPRRYGARHKDDLTGLRWISDHLPLKHVLKLLHTESPVSDLSTMTPALRSRSQKLL